jgi:hypothetical protein
MVWLWNSFEEYSEWVTPISVNKSTWFRRTQRRTTFGNGRKLFGNISAIQLACDALQKLGRDRIDEKNNPIPDARHLCLEIASEGEQLLLLHKRLATSKHAQDFIAEKDLFINWDHECNRNNTRRKVSELCTAAQGLLQGVDDFADVDESFLKDDLELPDFLRRDFFTARNLFSIGNDEMGLFAVGRAIEGVIRAILKMRAIELMDSKGKRTPAHEADFSDLIELTYRLRWKRTGDRLISNDARLLLQYLRSVRNSNAHPGNRTAQSSENAREVAQITVRTAMDLWRSVAERKTRLFTQTVTRDW